VSGKQTQIKRRIRFSVLNELGKPVWMLELAFVSVVVSEDSRRLCNDLEGSRMFQQVLECFERFNKSFRVF
jgi:hypothetical protein